MNGFAVVDFEDYPGSPGGTQPICCPKNSSGSCSSYSTATCCDRCHTCSGGTCVAGNGGANPGFYSDCYDLHQKAA